MSAATDCTCKFAETAQPLNSAGCEVHHGQDHYKCDRCLDCRDYRPRGDAHAFNAMRLRGHWPLCVCGHAAQDHN